MNSPRPVEMEIDAVAVLVLAVAGNSSPVAGLKEV
jgi:hypothetical protein